MGTVKGFLVRIVLWTLKKALLWRLLVSAKPKAKEPIGLRV